MPKLKRLSCRLVVGHVVNAILNTKIVQCQDFGPIEYMQVLMNILQFHPLVVIL